MVFGYFYFCTFEFVRDQHVEILLSPFSRPLYLLMFISYYRILTTDGRLLAHACAEEDSLTEEVLSTILANTYQEYSTAATGNFDAPQVQYICILIENGLKFMVAPLDDRFLIGLIAQSDCKFSVLQTKMDNIRTKLLTELSK